MALNEEQARRIFPLISAYGIAIEAGRVPAAELAALKAAKERDPRLLAEALDFARAYQQALARDRADVRVTDVTHPSVRCARVERLQQILGLEMELSQ